MKILDSIALDTLELVTVDIFDTLVTRLVDLPGEVFDIVDEKARQRGLAPTWLPVGGFSGLRRMAQQNAYLKVRAAGGCDPTLDEIYSELCVALPNALPDWRDLEIATEKELLRANPEILALLKACQARGLRVALVSDMYLDRSQLADLLSACSVEPALYERIFVSVDCGCSKSEGGMFDLLSRTYALSAPGRALHIGDDPLGDHATPRSKGWQTRLYSQFRGLPAAQEMQETLYGTPRFGFLAKARKFARLGAEPETDKALHAIGREVIGPFVTGFAEWVVDTAVTNDIELIAPCMREAHTLIPAIEAAASRLGAIVKCRPLYISRQAIALATLDPAGIDKALFDLPIPLAALIQRLEMNSSLPAELQPHASLPLNRLADHDSEFGTALVASARALLLCPDGRAALVGAIERERRSTVAYLSRIAGTAQRWGIVDYSHKGTIGRAVFEIGRAEGQPWETHSLISFGAPESLAEHRLAGHLVHPYLGHLASLPDALGRLQAHTALFEEYLFGDEGSTLRYALDEQGEPVVHTDLQARSAAELQRAASCQAGIFAFQATWNALRPPGRLQPGDVLHALLRLAEFPLPMEANALAETLIDCGYDTRRRISVCPPAAVELLHRHGPQAYLRAHASTRGEARAYWPEGVLAAHAPDEALSCLPRCQNHPYDSDHHTYFLLALAARRAGARRITIHGARVAGQALLIAARWAELEILAFADRDPGLIGKDIANIPILSHAAAAALAPDAALIGSLIRCAAIAQDIRPLLPEGTPIIDVTSLAP